MSPCQNTPAHCWYFLHRKFLIIAPSFTIHDPSGTGQPQQPHVPPSGLRPPTSGSGSDSPILPSHLRDSPSSQTTFNFHARIFIEEIWTVSSMKLRSQIKDDQRQILSIQHVRSNSRSSKFFILYVPGTVQISYESIHDFKKGRPQSLVIRDSSPRVYYLSPLT